MIAAADLIASGHELEARPGDPGRDGIDDVVPELVVSPRTAEAVAATLQWAATNTLSTVIRGQGSKMGWGARAHPIDVLLDLSHLNRVVAHEAGDLTVTVEAGIRLADLNGRLASHRQWLALDPPFHDRATIGGLLATNDSGPHRHRYGTPRDLVIGIHLATTDGQLAKAGGQVVKNVAGYDLSKILSGSFGSLAAIVGATFKLSPIPAASVTLALEELDPDRLVAFTDAVNASQLEPVAFEVHVRQRAGDAAVQIGSLIRFASFPGVVEAEAANASARLGRVHPLRTISGEAERQLWAAHGQRPWDETGVIVRASWRPADLKRVVNALTAIVQTGGFELIGRLGVGAAVIRFDQSPDAPAAVDRLRGSPVFGNVVVVRAPFELRTRDFVWGPGDDNPLLGSLKQELDPDGVLGAGRGPV